VTPLYRAITLTGGDAVGLHLWKFLPGEHDRRQLYVHE